MPHINLRVAHLFTDLCSYSVTNHCSDGHLKELRLGRVELVEQRERFINHLVVLVVRQILHTQPASK